jgi:alginate O-acetyltransferase complex protein AlgI
MLFNSHVFIFAFLPLALLVFYALGRAGQGTLARAWLVLASLFFYGWWNPSYLPLIVASLLFNNAMGLLVSARALSPGARRMVLAGGVAGNLAALGWFKYANFFVDNLHIAFGVEWTLAPIELPLAISFFTFQQIAYLVDAWRGGLGERSLLGYSIFVCFFPQLIAGPIVHHREMLPQFRSSAFTRLRRIDLEVGITIFSMGLFKKVVLADGVALYATPVFESVAQGGTPGLVSAWIAAIAYTLQLYFDFSGYSDMGIGIARMFGVWLPLNFASPYKSASMIDFWRRWHMTLSRFLRDYLYISLGGNRRGGARRYLNLFVTMLLGGLWHGAGWTFVVWGALHGLYLLINHGWRSFRQKLGWPSNGGVATRIAATALTFMAVLVGWVFFRADSLATALKMLSAMAGQSGVDWSEDAALQLGVLAVLLLIVFFAPNTQEWMADFEPALVEVPLDRSRLRWRPSRRWALVMALVSVWGLLGINQYSEFLYFQF